MTDRPLVIEGGQVERLPSATALQLEAPTAANASANLPHGTAPTSPVDGDIWTTTAGFFVRINGVTIGPIGNSVLNEIPAGAINGSNTAFSLANTPTAAGILLCLNGLAQQPGAGKDYLLAGANITMAVAPSSGDVLLCCYQH